MVQCLRPVLTQRHGGPVTQIETHISFVLLCGEHAYKIKKALRTPFLDQSTLAQRQWACLEELRLNRRLAPDLYLAMVPITGAPDRPELGGTGQAIDAAVQMRAFSQDGLWDGLAARGLLRASHIDELVPVLGRFHAAAASADPGGRLGTAGQVRAPLLQSLAELELGDDAPATQSVVAELRIWEAAAFERLGALMAQRLAQGRVRECHGDLHLGNVTLIDGHPTVFDGIEFNDDFRWIDVMSEVAFMAMDLHAHGLPHLAHRLVNGYLELGGDYGGVPLLDYYLVHRALVRAKVHRLRAAQCASAEQAHAERVAAERYIELALRLARRERRPPLLMLTHGFAASGKTSLSQGLLEALGAVRIRSDVERKRLAGLPAHERGGADLYGQDMTSATYARLNQLAAAVLDSGHAVILDATFLRRAQRDAARHLAALHGARCVLLDFEAEPDVLRQRLRQRAARGSDASDADAAVLSAQMRIAEPLQQDEGVPVWRCGPAVPSAEGGVQADWSPMLQWLADMDAEVPPRSA